MTKEPQSETDRIIARLNKPNTAPPTRTSSLLWGAACGLGFAVAIRRLLAINFGVEATAMIFTAAILFPAFVAHASNLVHYKALRAEYEVKEARRIRLLEEALRRDVN